MPQNQRREVVHEIDDFMPVGIAHSAAGRGIDEQRIGREVGAHSSVAAREVLARLFDQASGFRRPCLVGSKGVAPQAGHASAACRS